MTLHCIAKDLVRVQWLYFSTNGTTSFKPDMSVKSAYNQLSIKNVFTCSCNGTFEQCLYIGKTSTTPHHITLRRFTNHQLNCLTTFSTLHLLPFSTSGVDISFTIYDLSINHTRKTRSTYFLGFSNLEPIRLSSRLSLLAFSRIKVRLHHSQINVCYNEGYALH